MLTGFRRPGAAGTAARHLCDLTRARFGLDARDLVVASEMRSRMPGHPPVETVVAFQDADGTRYRFKVFKPLADVADDDIPPGWLRPGLVDYGDSDCGC
jgi:nitrate reductase delta subunit